MPETLPQPLMSKTYAQRQERYIRLFVYNSQALEPHLFGDSVLTRRVADVCAAFVKEVVPGDLTRDLYHQIDDEAQVRRLTDNLVADKEISDLIFSNTGRTVRKHMAVGETPEKIAELAAMNDKEFVERVVKYHFSSASSVACSSIASYVWEAYRHLMNKTLAPTSSHNNE